MLYNSFAVIIAAMGQAHSSPRETVSSAIMSPPSSSSSTQGVTDRESVDDLESKIVEAKINIRGFLDELPSIRKELDARYVVELQFHIKVIEQSIEKIRKIRQQCALEQKQNTTASTCSTAGSTCSAGGTPLIVTPPREPGNSNSGNEAALVNTNGSSSHQIRHVLAGTFTCSPSASKKSKNATTRSSGERAEAEAVDKQKQNKAVARTATRSSPRRKVVETKESDDHRQELSTAAEPSAQSTSANSSPQGRRTSSRKHVPTSIFESPEIPKANQKKNNGNKSSRITMRLRTVTAGAIDGFVMEDEVLYPVKIKERDGRMVTVAWRGGYSGTLKVRKGQIVPANTKTIAEWNKIVAEANDIREKLIKDREEKEARKRKKRQEELEVKRAKKARKEKMMELEKERKIKEDRAKMREKYGPPLDANLTSVPTAREEGDVKMEGSRIIYYAHEDDTPECIAKRFSVPVARIIYDNQNHVPNIAQKSPLKSFTPIILPQET